MKLYAYTAAALALLAAGAVAGWQVQGWRHGRLEAARLEHEAEVRRLNARTAQTASAGHEADRERVRVEFQTITREVEIVVEKPVYRNVCLDSDGLRLIERAARGGPATGEPGDAVPGPADAR